MRASVTFSCTLDTNWCTPETFLCALFIRDMGDVFFFYRIWRALETFLCVLDTNWCAQESLRCPPDHVKNNHSCPFRGSVDMQVITVRVKLRSQIKSPKLSVKI